MSSRFEFLGNTLVGQYIPGESWFHLRDPRAKLVSFVVLLVAIIFTPHLFGMLLGFAMVCLIYVISRLPFRTTWKTIRQAIPFIVILALLQIVFSAPIEGEIILWRFFSIEISHRMIINAVMLITRFAVLIALINVMVMSLSTAQVTTALFYLMKPFEKIGFPINDLTMVVQITLRYIPLVAQLAEKTVKAQASRGGDWEQRGFNPVRQARRILPLLVPLTVNSLKKAEIMAMAMESRGFNAGNQRSSFYEISFSWQDGVLMLAAILVSTFLLLINVFF